MKSVFGALLAASLFAAPAIAAPQYTVTLITLGGSNGGASDINNAGQVTGTSNIADNSGSHAFLYQNGVISDLGTLGTGVGSVGGGINASGQVGGYAFLNPQQTISHAAIFSNGAISDLGTLQGPNSNAFGRDINGLGWVTGEASAGQSTTHAFLYKNGAMQDIGTLGGFYSLGYGINDSGQITGESDTAADPLNGHAFIYSAGNWADLGTLGGSISTGYRINNAGTVVGASATATSSNHAFRYSGSLLDLGTLGGPTSGAYGINELGTLIVGGSDTASLRRHAFLYSNNLIIDLNDLIDPMSGWELFEAYGVNDIGQIVGVGIYQDRYQGFILNIAPPAGGVPEPGTWAMMIAGFGLAGAAARRRGRLTVNRIAV